MNTIYRMIEYVDDLEKVLVVVNIDSINRTCNFRDSKRYRRWLRSILDGRKIRTLIRARNQISPLKAEVGLASICRISISNDYVMSGYSRIKNTKYVKYDYKIEQTIEVIGLFLKNNNYQNVLLTNTNQQIELIPVDEYLEVTITLKL